LPDAIAEMLLESLAARYIWLVKLLRRGITLLAFDQSAQLDRRHV
jgi:hypothetical protein